MRKIASFFVFMMMVCILAVPNIVRAADNEKNEKNEYVVDLADVLSEEEEESIDAKLKTFRDKYKLDLVIVTTTGVQPDERMAFADDYYDENDYGYGRKHSGALLLVNIQDDGSYVPGNSWISTCGKAIDFITDNDISEIGRSITPCLTENQFVEAFKLFPALTGHFISEKRAKGTVVAVVVAIIFCIVFATVRLLIEMSKHKSVEQAREANQYMVADSLQLAKSYDHFLYSTVTKTKKESSNGGSSSIHISSSGRSHGGGGF